MRVAGKDSKSKTFKTNSYKPPFPPIHVPLFMVLVPIEASGMRLFATRTRMFESLEEQQNVASSKQKRGCEIVMCCSH